jgi:hypothetical protein
MTDIGSLSLETTSTFSLNNTSKMNMPDFYVFCSPERSNEREYQKYRQLPSDFNRVKKYLMTTEPTSPYKTLVFKQAIKVL